MPKKGNLPKQKWEIVGQKPLQFMEDLEEQDLVCVALRGVQYKSKCANRTLGMAIDALKPHLRCSQFDTFKSADKAIKDASGSKCLRLHGCVVCNCHVFGPCDKAKICPVCEHPRYDDHGQPNEVCWYFPLREKLQRLLSLSIFRDFLKHEMKRPHNPKYMSDVYDAPMWVRVAGHFDRRGRLTRILLQYCMDGIPAFSYGGLSVKPCEFLILNLPPTLRFKVNNMLLHMLIPNHLKGQAAKKYYDWAAAFEMNDLHARGVCGVKVIVYGTTLDAPGRAENLQMQTHTAYYNCPLCEHRNDPGLGTKPVYCGFRCFLPAGHPWRQRTFMAHGYQYEFPDVEDRSPPELRTTQSAFEGVQMATPTRPFRGHKAAPLLSGWLSFSWDMITSDVMHDIKNVCNMSLKGLVGHGSHGMYESWDAKKDEAHREFCRFHNIFPEVHDGTNPLPWRLSREAVNILDARVKAIFWPHYMDVLHKNGFSFWKKSHMMWKSRHKAMVFLVGMHFIDY